MIQNQQNNPQVLAQTYQSDISDHFAMGSAPQHLVGSPDLSGLYASQLATRFTTAAMGNNSNLLGTSPSMNDIAAASALLASSPPQQQNINLAQNLNYLMLNQLASQQVIPTQQNPNLSGSYSNQHLNIGNNQLGVSPSNFSPAAVNQQEINLAGSPQVILQPQPTIIPTSTISNMPQNINTSMQPRAIPINANQGISNLVGSPMGGSGFSLETPPAWIPGSLGTKNRCIN